MKALKLILLFLSFISIENCFSQTFIKPNNTWGLRYNRMKLDSALVISSDTVNNKLVGSIAHLNDKFYIKNTDAWEEVGGTSDPTLAATRIAFGSDENHITSSALATFLNNRIKSDSGFVGAYIDDFSKLSFWRGFNGMKVHVTEAGRGGDFVFHPSSENLTVDSGIVMRAANGGYWVRDISQFHGYNVQWWGAVGDSVHDDTRAIDLAADYVSTAQSLNYSQVRGTNKAILYFPAAKQYLYTGDGIGRKMGGAFHIKGDGASQTRIKINNPDIYFIDDSVNTKSFIIEGIQVVGTYKGIYRNKFVNTIGGNSVNSRVFQNCTFTGYTVCAISSNSRDDPFYKIVNCKFNGTDSSTAIMLQGGGGSKVEDCWFVGGYCYIHVLGAAGVLIQHNNFNGARVIDGGKVDIWVEPKFDDTGNFPSGEGLHITDNTHGNEHDDSLDVFYLFAISDTSENEEHETNPDWGSYRPLKDTVPFGSYRLRNIVIDNEKLSADGTVKSGIIVSYIENVGNCSFGRGFVFDNNAKYLIEFPKRTAFGNANIAVSTNIIDVSHANFSAPLQYVSNVPGFGRLIDPQLHFRGDYSAYPVGNIYDPNYKNVIRDTLTASTTTVSFEHITGADGEQSAYAVTLNQEEGRCYVPLDTTGMMEGVPIWIEFDLAAADDSSLTDISVRIADQYSTGNSGGRWQIKVPEKSEGWRTFTLSKVYVKSFASTGLKVFFGGGNVQQTYPDMKKFKIGRIRVYQAKTVQEFPGGYWVTDSATTFNKVAVFDSDTLKNTSFQSLADSLKNYLTSLTDAAHPKIVRLFNDFVTTSSTASNTALAQTVEADKIYKFKIILKTSCGATGGMKFTITAPSGSSLLSGTYTQNATSNTGVQYGRLPDLGVQTSVAANRYAGAGAVTLEGYFTTSSTTGDVMLQCASATDTETSTILTGSVFELLEVTDLTD